jgi:hypothetical protein
MKWTLTMTIDVILFIVVTAITIGLVAWDIHNQSKKWTKMIELVQVIDNSQKALVKDIIVNTILMYQPIHPLVAV